MQCALGRQVRGTVCYLAGDSGDSRRLTLEEVVAEEWRSGVEGVRECMPLIRAKMVGSGFNFVRKCVAFSCGRNARGTWRERAAIGARGLAGWRVQGPGASEQKGWQGRIRGHQRRIASWRRGH